MKEQQQAMFGEEHMHVACRAAPLIHVCLMCLPARSACVGQPRGPAAANLWNATETGIVQLGRSM